MIEKLLGDVPVGRFLEEHYLRQPLAMPGGCREFCRLGDWGAIERMLAAADADVIVGRHGEQWAGPRPTNLAEARDVLAKGYTIGVRHAERHDAGLAELAAGFRRDFWAEIDVHAYCTPGGCPGFGWHYDAEEVFVLQTLGTKEWQLRKNTVNPWPLVETLPADMRHEREIMPLVRCTLAAGDWLYIPTGWWHRTEAAEESISLSVGVLAATAMDVYDFLRRRLLDSLRWRQRLPAFGGLGAAQESDAVMGRFRALFGELGADLARELRRPGLVEEFLEDRKRAVGRERAGEV
jgi:ribosomal protein L16 Arg81 hydroxylase